MQIANAQLQLANNPHLASLALRLADEKVLSLANPSLTNVRRAIAEELRALDSMERPDVEGATLTLSSLAGVVDTLPLTSDVEMPDNETGEIDGELSGMDRAMASLKSAMSSVVSVRQIEEAERPFVAPEAEYFLRANLSLQLQAARLALLQGEKNIFDRSIDDAARWLADYYDADSAAVQNAIDTLNSLKTGSFTAAPPDISRSLRLLRQYVALSEFGSAGQEADTNTEAAEPDAPSPEPET